LREPPVDRRYLAVPLRIPLAGCVSLPLTGDTLRFLHVFRWLVA
jgi:hypothetical protein